MTATEPAAPPADESTTTEPAATPETDVAAELEKWKTMARKQEERAKANAQAAKELDEFKRQSMTDQERAVAEAVDAARKSTIAELSGRLVDAEVRAAAAGRNVDVDALLEGLDRGRFLTDTGEPDRQALTSWIDRVAPVAASQPPPAPAWPDLGQGARTDSMALNGDPLLQALKGKLGIG